MTVRPPAGRSGETASAKPQVFVSYAHQDGKLAVRLARDLEADGFDVWFDRGRMHGGDAIPEEIAQAIRSADFFLLVVSRHSNESAWVRSELRKAVTWQNDAGRPRTIPIRRGSSPLPAIVGEI